MSERSKAEAHVVWHLVTEYERGNSEVDIDDLVDVVFKNANVADAGRVARDIAGQLCQARVLRPVDLPSRGLALVGAASRMERFEILPSIRRRWARFEGQTPEKSPTQPVVAAAAAQANASIGDTHHHHHINNYIHNHIPDPGAEQQTGGRQTPDVAKFDEVPAEYRYDGKPDGKPLTVRYLGERYGLTGSYLSKKATDDSCRMNVGRAYVYKWNFVLSLTEAKNANQDRNEADPTPEDIANRCREIREN